MKLVAILSLALVAAACAGAAPTPSPTPSPSPTGTPTPMPTPTPTPSPRPSPTNKEPFPPTPGASPGTPAAEDLNGRVFLSVKITENGQDFALVAKTVIRLSFDSGIGIHAGCNSMGGQYEIHDGKLEVGQMMQTEMGCEQALMAQDQWVAAFIGSKPSVSLSGNDLTLTGTAITAQFTDEQVLNPDQPLAGPTWVVTSIIQGDVASSAPVEATLTFHDTGRVDVAAGCNSGGGPYELNGDKITFGAIALTKMACPGDRAAVENAVVAMLNASPVTFSIDGKTLQLRAGQIGLDLTAR